ncbi:hypothetical protein GGQ05_001736 [Salinibacter ruber]|jgi:hypothetical protein|uniref:Uncharacterized protein n=1 Tax=Salinibacter ruber TaxID=146919 RepID=A0A9X2TJK8_9BACT|nr:hypothetical protein [Salinibacter ruber]MCS3709903.1 hypothetical protein [Salinibacter ruber]MCS4170270.1 hypothetical protein [Salinibacter ruber]
MEGQANTVTVTISGPKGSATPREFSRTPRVGEEIVFGGYTEEEPLHGYWRVTNVIWVSQPGVGVEATPIVEVEPVPEKMEDMGPEDWLHPEDYLTQIAGYS